MKRCALYVRVSTEEQKIHGYSVDSQIKALQDYCKEKGYKIFKVYNDAGISARKTYKKRPALLEMVADCQAGNIDLILVTKLDRFFRSVSDYYAVMDQVNGVPWRAIWEDYETETSAGVFKVNIMLSVAQAESDRTSERIKAINDYKKACGQYIGSKCLLGYKVENKTIVLDEETKPYVDMIFTTYISTLSSKRVLEVLRDNDFIITRRRLYSILKAPQYTGNYSGIPCYAYITEEQHNFIVNNLTTCSEKSNTKATYLFSGLVVCGCCGGRLSGHYQNNHSNGKKYHYKSYKCPRAHSDLICSNRAVYYERPIEKFLINNIEDILQAELIEANLQPKNKSNITAKIKKLDDRLERIKTLFEMGDITITEYKAKKAELLIEKGKLVKEKTPYTALQLPSNWLAIYKGLDDEHKRMFWRKVVGKITLYNNPKKFEVELL